MADHDPLAMVASGMSVSAVARQLKTTVDEAAAAVAEAARQAAASAPDLDDATQIELAHLEMLRRAATPAALRGEMAAIRALVRVHESKVALLGLTDGAGAPGDIDEEVSLVDELRARRAQRRAHPSSA